MAIDNIKTNVVWSLDFKGRSHVNLVLPSTIERKHFSSLQERVGNVHRTRNNKEKGSWGSKCVIEMKTYETCLVESIYKNVYLY